MLKNKSVIFLGSSVTYGNNGYSFVEMLAEKYDLNYIKEAVSGTALADTDGSSYVSRLLKVDRGFKADAFVCQLSTNDAGRNMPLGSVSGGFEFSDLDRATTDGAIEFIIKYVRETWGCPIFFYTGTRFDSPHYGKMVDDLIAIAGKWGITLIDMWNAPEMNDLPPEKVKEYMNDPVHPTTEGYRAHWLPFMEKVLNDNL